MPRQTVSFKGVGNQGIQPCLHEATERWAPSSHVTKNHSSVYLDAVTRLALPATGKRAAPVANAAGASAACECIGLLRAVTGCKTAFING
jgi:hypothetical protein